MARMHRWFWHAGAVVVYALCAWAVVVHGATLHGLILGGGSDALAFVWFLGWWPYALTHHLNPFFTHLVWQPQGLNLAWVTSVPALALLALPVTQLFGPVLSFNLLTLAAPIVSALAAYALCLYVARRPSAALLGGFMFGFGSYAMARQNEQLNLETTCLVPCLVLLVLARLDGRIGRLGTALAGAAMLAALAGISLEMFATTVLSGGFAWLLAWGMLPPRRVALGSLFADALFAAPLLLLALFPLLWALFALPHDVSLPSFWPRIYATDLLNPIIPTGADRIGGLFFAPVSQNFPGNVSEQSGYLGLPLIILLWLALRGGRAYLRWLLVAMVIASLGPRLWLAGHNTGIPLPWALIHVLPLMNKALPARMMLYADLAAAIAAALWLAEAIGWREQLLRLGFGLLAAIMLWPAPRPVQKIPYSTFFQPGRVKQVLGQNPRIAILPFGFYSPSMFWQAESGFAFAQTGGYLGFPPARVQDDGVLMRIFFGIDDPAKVQGFTAYCHRTATNFVIAGPGAPADMVSGLRALGWPARQVDDVTILTVPAAP